MQQQGPRQRCSSSSGKCRGLAALARTQGLWLRALLLLLLLVVVVVVPWCHLLQGMQHLCQHLCQHKAYLQATACRRTEGPSAVLQACCWVMGMGMLF
jgi:hypothetical protein